MRRLNKKLAEKVLRERQIQREIKQVFDLSTFLFKEQLDFVTDIDKFVTACCSVRSGKTVSCAADLISTALNMPGSTGLYITLARSSAKRIVWPELKAINKQFKLGFKFNNTELSATIEIEGKESRIYCSGANTDVEIQKLRGLSNVAVAYIDEAQSFRALIKELVEDVIIKRLYDTNGRLRVIGTPGPVLSGWFYDICHSVNWKHHAWTMHQNPWLVRKSGKTPEELIKQDCDQRGCPISDPSIQRECFGRWVYDPNSLLLQYSRELNDYQNLPQGRYTYLLGIDLGLRDQDSLSLLAFSDNSPITYLVEEILTPNQLTDALALQIKTLMEKHPISEMPTDTGGLGAKIVEDLKSRYGLPLTPADKKDKMANYRHLNNALRNGTFKAKANSQFARDCDTLEIDRDKSKPDKIVVKGHSDAVDSCLYAFKLSPAYAYEAPLAKPKPGTAEFLKQQEELHLQAALDKVKKEKEIQEGKGSQYGIWNTDKKGLNPWHKW